MVQLSAAEENVLAAALHTSQDSLAGPQQLGQTWKNAGPKMAYWVAAQTLLCAILETIWVDPQEQLLLPVSDGALAAAIEFE